MEAPHVVAKSSEKVSLISLNSVGRRNGSTAIALVSNTSGKFDFTTKKEH